MSYPMPLRETVHLTCPGCWSNTLAQTLSPPPGFPGLAWYQCTVCSWTGSSDDLRTPTCESEIRACMREDQHRGEPGSSGSGKQSRKPNAHKGFVPREPWDTGEKTRTQQLGQTKSKGVRWGKFVLWVTDQEWSLLLRIAGGSYPEGLRPHMARVLCGKEPESADQVREAFNRLGLEFLSRTS